MADSGKNLIAIVGLGNPGQEYEMTRHNVGFRAVMTLEKLATENLPKKLTPEVLAEFIPTHPSGWNSKFNCQYKKINIENKEVLLVLPWDYMNNSGQALRPLLDFFKIDYQENLIVVYDELDLAPGILRIRKGGSAGGHNGIKDLENHLGSGEFKKIRIGIGHPRDLNPDRPRDVSAYVLSAPPKADRQIINEATVRAAEASISLLSNSLETAQREFN